VVTLRDDLAGTSADAGTLEIAGRSLVALHDWTFLIGPSFCVGVNGLLLGYLFYRSGLVPRQLAVFGLIGGPLIFASGTGVLFGLYGQFSAWSAIATIPVFAWEMSLAAWLIVRGFKPSPIISGTRSTVNADAGYAPA
jgi:hypothetical protein